MTDAKDDRKEELKRLGKNSIVYFLTNILIRSLGFFLVPLYSRALTPADYGIMSLAGTVRSLLAMVMALAIHSAIVPLHNRAKSEEERKRLYGSILVFLAVLPPLVTALLDVGGRVGVLDIFRGVPFTPYMELAIWGACVSVFQEVPSSIFIAREKPLGVTIFGIFSALVGTGWNILFIVVLQQGAAGSLRAAIAAMATNALYTFVVVGRMASLRVSFPLLKQALAMSIPLVPHLFSHWLLAAVDRIILEESVGDADLGLYSLGSQFADVERMVVQSVLTALSPIVLRRLSANERDPTVPRLGTYAFFLISIASLGAAFLAGDVLSLMTPPAYHGATVLIPWLVLGVAVQAIYGIFTMSFWHTGKTRIMPLLTAIAGGINVVVLLVTVRRMGVVAAPISIAVSYGVLALTYGIAGHRLFPIHWEYRRWIPIGTAALGWYVVGLFLPDMPHAAAIVVKILVACVAYPLTLLVLRVPTSGELTEMRAALRRLPLLRRAAG